MGDMLGGKGGRPEGRRRMVGEGMHLKYIVLSQGITRHHVAGSIERIVLYNGNY